MFCKIHWSLRITQWRITAYTERTRRMPNVSQTYISFCERMSILSHTLMPYAVVWLHFIEISKIYLCIKISYYILTQKRKCTFYFVKAHNFFLLCVEKQVVAIDNFASKKYIQKKLSTQQIKTLMCFFLCHRVYFCSCHFVALKLDHVRYIYWLNISKLYYF